MKSKKKSFLNGFPRRNCERNRQLRHDALMTEMLANVNWYSAEYRRNPAAAILPTARATTRAEKLAGDSIRACQSDVSYGWQPAKQGRSGRLNARFPDFRGDLPQFVAHVRRAKCKTYARRPRIMQDRFVTSRPGSGFV